MRAAADHNDVAGPAERVGAAPTGVPAARGEAAAQLHVPEPVAEPAVSITDLHVVHRRSTVLTGVTCSAAPGAVTVIVGSVGSGARALLRVIAGRLRATCGTVTVLGLPPGAPALRRRVLYAPAGRVDPRDAGTARALARYDVVLLDDPTAGLDPVDREACWRQLRALAAGGTAVVAATPSTADAKHSTRAVLLRHGAVLADDTPARLRAATGTGDLDEAFLRLAAQAAAAAR